MIDKECFILQRELFAVNHDPTGETVFFLISKQAILIILTLYFSLRILGEQLKLSNKGRTLTFLTPCFCKFRK